MPSYILGISSYYHDSAAALLRDGEVLAAAQEERFSRKKHDERFPAGAMAYCLQHAGIGLGDVAHVAFYDKPLVKFERLLETYLAYAPRGFKSFATAMPIWLKDKLFLKKTLRRELSLLSGIPEDRLPQLLFAEHHRSHAGSAFFPSPYPRAAVLCLDGVGEWATSSVWRGDGSRLSALWEIRFPHSLGMLYSAFTYYTGFKVNSGEYKLMGLAPYGTPRYVDAILEELIDLKADGTFRLNMEYFEYPAGFTMTGERFDRLFGGPPRPPESMLTQREMDLAASIQAVTEEIVLRLGRTVHAETGESNLCLAGGVALNCVANGRLLREGPFENIWVQPAAGDAGGALGAALCAWHEYLGNDRVVSQPGSDRDAMKGSYLGPSYDSPEIATALEALGARYQRLPEAQLIARVAEVLEQGNVVGWFQGRMEFGPRALGARSILGDARSERMQSTMNLRIKYRESFRPFAPSIKRERVSDWFELDGSSPYMLIVADVKNHLRREMSAQEQQLFGIDKLNVPRSAIPAVTHVDYSARVQTVEADVNPRFHALLDAFEQRTGCPILVNTSFNVRGEPIVCTPEDAYRCFMRTDMEYLVVEDFVLEKAQQPEFRESDEWRKQLVMD
jgi:carbamoyltransferase